MNLHYLLSSTVRLSASLVARLATSQGVRTPLVRAEGEFFLEMTKELERLGVSRRVGADMFGLIRRSYLKKIQRLTQSQTEVGRTLWEAVYEYLVESKQASRQAVLDRFRHDDSDTVAGVLHDMCDSNLIVSEKKNEMVWYRPASTSELGEAGGVASPEALEELLWAVIYGSGPMTRSELLKSGKRAEADLDSALARLEAAGRISIGSGDSPVYRSEERVVPEGEGSGWEAAVFDHLRAVIDTLCQTLSGERPDDLPFGSLGGSTYTLDVWNGHPHAEEAYGLLREFRNRVSELREKVDTYNAEHGRNYPHHALTIYAGQGATIRTAETQE